MSPLVAPPARGYAEWQRIANYDSNELIVFPFNPGGGIVQTGVIDVSRFAYLGGFVKAIAGDFSVQAIWFSAFNGGDIVGKRSIPLTSNINTELQMRIANLGPYVQLTFNTIGGGGYSGLCIAFGTNRIHPLEVIPEQQVVIDKQAAALGASASVTVYPLDYSSSPARMLVSAGQAFTASLQYLTFPGVWNTYDQNSGGAGAVLSVATLIPAGAWRLVVTNQSAIATTFTCTITPNVTGST